MKLRGQCSKKTCIHYDPSLSQPGASLSLHYVFGRWPGFFFLWAREVILLNHCFSTIIAFNSSPGSFPVDHCLSLSWLLDQQPTQFAEDDAVQLVASSDQVVYPYLCPLSPLNLHRRNFWLLSHRHSWQQPAQLGIEVRCGRTCLTLRNANLTWMASTSWSSTKANNATGRSVELDSRRFHRFLRMYIFNGSKTISFISHEDKFGLMYISP